MNMPDAPRGSAEGIENVAPDLEEDDVEGHRMMTPDQAQRRSEAARREREQRLADEDGTTSTA